MSEVSQRNLDLIRAALGAVLFFTKAVLIKLAFANH